MINEYGNFVKIYMKNYFEKDDLNKQQWRFLIAYMTELLIDDDDQQQEKQEENKKLINKLCEILALQIDPIRKKILAIYSRTTWF